MILLRTSAIGVAIPLIIKLIEMVRLVFWTVRHGPRFIDELDLTLLRSTRADELLQSLLNHGYPLYPERSIFIACLSYALGEERAIRMSARFFRFPTLMILASLIAGVRYDAFTWAALAPLIFCGMWVWIAQMFSMRFVFGPVHTVLEVPCMAPARWRSHLAVGSHTPLRFFITMYAASYVVLVLGYAAIYSGIAAGALPFASMVDMDESVPAFLETVYFSVATLLTVGYGDVGVEGPVGRIVAISHMSAGFVLLVLLLTAFSVSHRLDDSDSSHESGPA